MNKYIYIWKFVEPGWRATFAIPLITSGIAWCQTLSSMITKSSGARNIVTDKPLSHTPLDKNWIIEVIRCELNPFNI